MNFIQIEHLNDLLPYLKGKEDIFQLSVKDGYQVIDYHLASAKDFNNDGTFDCRGIKFDLQGELICRPLHKFFNLGENPELEAQQKSPVSQIQNKLDGSMIATAWINGNIRFTTRAGITDVSKLAEMHCLTPRVERVCAQAFSEDITLIFEFTSPENRIVVRYEDTCLTLLAARHNLSGTYLRTDELQAWAANLGVMLPNRYQPYQIASLRDWKGCEGVVVWHADGYAYKIKTDEYVLRHRTKDSLRFSKDLLQMILTGADDDLVNLLDAGDFQRVAKFKGDFLRELRKVSEGLERYVHAALDASRKDFALKLQQELDRRVHPVAFRMYSTLVQGSSFDTFKAMQDWALGFTKNQKDARELCDFLDVEEYKG